MSTWTALIVLQIATANPYVISTPSGPPNEPQSVHVGPTDDMAKGGVDLTLNPAAMNVGRMIGVEATTTINTPSAVMATFDTSVLCETAKAQLLKAPGITSVTCFQSH